MFDIIWCDSENATEAIKEVNLLPEAELLERNKYHSFRMWERCPVPALDGARLFDGMCICTDFRGSFGLHPGGSLNGRLLIIDLIKDYTVVNDGFIGANIKEETYNIKSVQVERKNTLACEKLNKKEIQKREEEYQAECKKAMVDGMRRFLVAVGHMTITGTRDPKKLSNDDLRDIWILNQMAGVQFPDLDKWLAMSMPAPIEKTVLPEHYDPTTFFEHVSSVASKIDRTTKNIIKKANGEVQIVA